MSTRRHLALLGGFRHAPTEVAADSYLAVAVIGGLDLDLAAATLPASGITITKVAFVGGAHVRVPPGSQVELTGVSLFGRRRVTGPATTSGGPVVRVRAFGVVGGVHVER